MLFILHLVKYIEKIWENQHHVLIFNFFHLSMKNFKLISFYYYDNIYSDYIIFILITYSLHYDYIKLLN